MNIKKKKPSIEILTTTEREKREEGGGEMGWKFGRRQTQATNW